MSKISTHLTKQIALRINPELNELVSKESKKKGQNSSKWIRDCIIAALIEKGYTIDEISPIKSYITKVRVRVNDDKVEKIDESFGGVGIREFSFLD